LRRKVVNAGLYSAKLHEYRRAKSETKRGLSIA
jgi:hypothetical protein